MNKIMKYKDYFGSVEYSKDDDLYSGKIKYTKSLFKYEGKTFEELRSSFEKAVDEYIIYMHTEEISHCVRC